MAQDDGGNENGEGAGGLRPAEGGAALLIIDLINRMDFPGAEALREGAATASEAVLRLRGEADRLGVPAVYVNDNHGQWHSERARIVEACTGEDSPGRELSTRLAPRRDDFFVIKPQVSGFYATNLPVLLPRLKVSRLVLTGVAADICVLFTAADAHMREYRLWAPADAVASPEPRRTGWALEIMRETMGAETRPTTELGLEAWLRGGEG